MRNANKKVTFYIKNVEQNFNTLPLLLTVKCATKQCTGTSAAHGFDLSYPPVYLGFNGVSGTVLIEQGYNM